MRSSKPYKHGVPLWALSIHVERSINRLTDVQLAQLRIVCAHVFALAMMLQGLEVNTFTDTWLEQSTPVFIELMNVFDFFAGFRQIFPSLSWLITQRGKVMSNILQEERTSISSLIALLDCNQVIYEALTTVDEIAIEEQHRRATPPPPPPPVLFGNLQVVDVYNMFVFTGSSTPRPSKHSKAAKAMKRRILKNPVFGKVSEILTCSECLHNDRVQLT